MLLILFAQIFFSFENNQQSASALAAALSSIPTFYSVNDDGGMDQLSAQMYLMGAELFINIKAKS